MATDGWVSLSLKESLVRRIDLFLEANSEGFSNRAEVIAAALRQFLDGKESPISRDELRKALTAVAMTKPQTVEALLRALLAELSLDGGRARPGVGEPPRDPNRGRPASKRLV